jgi:hypothetical protein
MVGRILQASHIYYVSYWLSSQAQFKCLEYILWSYLWSKYGRERGLQTIPWDVCIMPKDGGARVDWYCHPKEHPFYQMGSACLEGTTPW